MQRGPPDMASCVTASLQKAFVLLDDAENSQQFQTKFWISKDW